MTFVLMSDKGVVALFAAGMELHSCCQACLFILAVEVHFCNFRPAACCILAARCISFSHFAATILVYFFFPSYFFLSRGKG
jgi:hypothetical protein